MKWMAIACVALGCQQSGTQQIAVSGDYAEDVSNICNVMELSGATKMSNADARYTTATWFGSHLKTEQAHKFMVEIQPLVGEPKAKALEAEARKVGLPSCALADVWRR